MVAAIGFGGGGAGAAVLGVGAGTGSAKIGAGASTGADGNATGGTVKDGIGTFAARVVPHRKAGDATPACEGGGGGGSGCGAGACRTGLLRMLGAPQDGHDICVTG